MTTTTNNDELFSRYELWCEEHETTATLIRFAHWLPMQKRIDELTEQLLQRTETEDTHL